VVLVLVVLGQVAMDQMVRQAAQVLVVPVVLEVMAQMVTVVMAVH
jgi:hypothetical protein